MNDMKDILEIPNNLIEEKLVSFFETLKSLGISDEKIKEIGGGLVTISNTSILAKISSLMDEEEFNKWKEFVDTGANTAQQIVVMNAFLNRKGHSLESITDTVLETLMKNTLDEIKITSDLRSKVGKLHDEEVKLANKLLDENRFDELDKLLEK